MIALEFVTDYDTTSGRSSNSRAHVFLARNGWSESWRMRQRDADRRQGVEAALEESGQYRALLRPKIQRRVLRAPEAAR